MKSYENCLHDFLRGVNIAESVDYSDMKSIRKSNRGVGIYRKNAKYIADFYSNKTCDFLYLLNHENENVRICCAACAIEFMQVDENQKEVIKSIIQKHSDKSDPAEQMGWHVWLRQYNLL